MLKSFIKSSLGIALALLFFSSCEKEKNDNPTNGRSTAKFNSSVHYGTLTDKDGNTYKTVIIGTQTWMAENLRTTKYNDGTAIPNVTDDNSWESLTTGAYCNYKNTTNIDTIATYGRLYNWYTVNTGKLAPKGWHVPTNDEWATLINYLGGETVAGGKLKETGTDHWKSPNTNATNETGFTALPGGRRLSYTIFLSLDYYGYWWNSIENNPYGIWNVIMLYNCPDVYRDNTSKNSGYSVRCIMD